MHAHPKPRTWLDQVICNPVLSELATAVAMLISDTADQFACAPRPNPKRLAGELGETLPAVLAAIAELTKQGHLEMLPNVNGRRKCRLVMAGSSNRRAAPTKVAAVIIPYDEGERLRRWADQHAGRMATMPQDQADGYLRRLLCRHGERRSLISAAYWRAVLKPGDGSS